MNWLRVFLLGGITSYRALFHWLNPWIFVPMLIVYPAFQLIFFVYLGRAAGIESDRFFVIGNGLLAVAMPALWGMSHSITGERRTQTLATLIGSPASRTALFLGRGVPTVVNGVLVALCCLALGAMVIGVVIPVAVLPGVGLCMLVSAYSCAALGICVGAFGLRGRNVTAIDNLLIAALLLGSGANVPLDRFPPWVAAISPWLPLTNGIAAARKVVDGATVSSVGDLLLWEIGNGTAYLMLGMLLLRIFEWDGRRTASFDRF